jgi:redox-regulated HSP33 family molecular chaperone
MSDLKAPIDKDYLLACIDPQKRFSMRFVSLKNTIEQVFQQKKPSASLGLFLAESLIGSILLGSRTSDQESTLFKYILTNPDVRVNCEVSPVGAVRCAVFPPEHRQKVLPEWLDGSLNVAVLNQDREVYESVIEFKQSSAVEIYAEYTSMSYQTDCILLLNGDANDVSKNYGLLLERLPDTTDEDWDDFQSRFADGEKFVQSFQHSTDPDQMMNYLFDRDFKVLKVLFPKLTCSCSRERFIKAIELLSQEDLMELFVANQGITSQCEYCQQVWEASDDDIKRLLGMSKNVKH